MGKKNVLEVAFPALNNSGVPAVIMGIVRELHNDLNFDVLVFRKNAGHHEKEFISYGGKIHHIDSDKTGNVIKDIAEKLCRPWRLYSGTRKILRNGHYQAIHCHNGFDSCWCLMAAKKEGVPVRVAHSHASVNPYEKRGFLIKLYEAFSRNLINRCSTDRIGCSQIAGDRLYGKGNTTQVVVNAVDLSRFNPADHAIRKFNREQPMFVFVGRLTEQKNPAFIINLFSLILESFPKARLTIVGFGPKEGMVKRLIDEKKLEKNICLLPHSSDIPNILAESDFFLLPSFFEGLPVVLVESQTMGVYAFISDTVAKESNLGVCEFLSLKAGVDEWKNRIIEVVNSYKERKYPSHITLDKYSWSTAAEKYLRVYLGRE